MPDDPKILIARLQRARQRMDAAPPYSPDWDAAMALIEEIERRLADIGEQVPDPRLTAPVPI